MKKFFIISLLALFIVINDSTYCEGWDDGYEAGYCHEIEGCIPPIPPICPIPQPDCNEGYKCGYNRGFAKALKDREEDFSD